MLIVIDSHTHLDSLEDPEAAIQEALAAGVEWIVSIGTSIESIEATLALAEQHADCVRVGVGIHPNSAAQFDLDDWPRVEELAKHELVCAIGETGFDQFHKRATLEQQDVLFDLHVDLASRLNHPLIIHTRAAEGHTLTRLRDAAEIVGDDHIIMHCFSMPDYLETVLETNYVMSFAGNATYGSAEDLRTAAIATPGNRLMIETDAPYLTPVPHRGKKNQPAFVAHTLDCLSEARGESRSETELLTTATAKRVFGLG